MSWILLNYFTSTTLFIKYAILFFLILASISRENFLGVPYYMKDFCIVNKNLSDCSIDSFGALIIFIMLSILIVIVSLYMLLTEKDDNEMVKYKAKLRSIILMICILITLVSIAIGLAYIVYNDYDISTGYYKYGNCTEYKVNINNYKQFMDYCRPAICNNQHYIGLIGGCSLIGYTIIFICIIVISIIIIPSSLIYNKYYIIKSNKIDIDHKLILDP